jgi:hypothetical protein
MPLTEAHILSTRLPEPSTYTTDWTSTTTTTNLIPTSILSTSTSTDFTSYQTSTQPMRTSTEPHFNETGQSTTSVRRSAGRVESSTASRSAGSSSTVTVPGLLSTTRYLQPTESTVTSQIMTSTMSVTKSATKTSAWTTTTVARTRPFLYQPTTTSSSYASTTGGYGPLGKGLIIFFQ